MGLSLNRDFVLAIQPIQLAYGMLVALLSCHLVQEIMLAVLVVPVRSFYRSIKLDICHVTVTVLRLKTQQKLCINSWIIKQCCVHTCSSQKLFFCKMKKRKKCNTPWSRDSNLQILHLTYMYTDSANYSQGVRIISLLTQFACLVQKVHI